MENNNKLSEGVIKYSYNWKKTSPLKEDEYIDIERWRTIFFKLGLIGEYPIEKLGYGNLSKKNLLAKEDEFIITGTQTGHLPELTGAHYTKVHAVDLKKNKISAKGPIKPSSESLSHYSIYNSNKLINYVFHVHSPKLWEFMKINENSFLATSENIDYGTLGMADEVSNLVQGKTSGLILMKGHQDGIISFGRNSEETGKLLLDLHRSSK